VQARNYALMTDTKFTLEKNIPPPKEETSRRRRHRRSRDNNEIVMGDDRAGFIPEPERPYHHKDLSVLTRDNFVLKYGYKTITEQEIVECDNTWKCPRIREWVAECNKLEDLNERISDHAYKHPLPKRPLPEAHTHQRPRFRVAVCKPAQLRKLRELATLREYCPLYAYPPDILTMD
jgi:hypothetical protein